MNVVFLSPDFPPNYVNFCTRLRAAGANVLGISSTRFESLNHELRDNLNYYYRVDDMHNWDQLCNGMHFLAEHYGKIDRIDSQNEYWLGTESGLRSDFNIFGLKREGIEKIKRKSLMKKVFQDAGLNPARGRVCQSSEEVEAFIAEVGFPVVAKPDIGVGAARTYKLENQPDVEKYLREKPYVDYILEEYLTGLIVSFDGLVDEEGRPMFTSSLRYNEGVMDIVNNDSDINYVTVREIEPTVIEAGMATLKAFDVRERFFHFEFFLFPDGSVRPMEVNMRPPGGFTLEMFNYGYDFDCYKIWAELLVQRIKPEVGKQKYFVNYIGRKDNKRYAMSHEEIFSQFGSLIVMHDRMSDALSPALGNYCYIVRHKDLQPVLDAATAIQEQAY